MCNKGKKCNLWLSLLQFNINGEGCLLDPSWLKNVNILSSHNKNKSGELYVDSNIKLRLIKNVAHGTFGYIDLCKLECVNGEIKEVYVKRPIIGGNSLLYEACMQKIVENWLSHGNIISGVPKVLHIFSLNDNSICFAMEIIENSITLHELLEKTSKEEITSLLIDCLIQLCAITWKLDKELGINHRDLKPSNILVIIKEPQRKKIIINNECLEITSKYTISFIDFGFSCLGSDNGRNLHLSLSNVYGIDDPCPKSGRDMYLFLSFLYSDFSYKLNKDICTLFKKWLEIPHSDFIKFLSKYKEKAAQWIYFLTGNSNIKQFDSCPLKIIKDLKGLLHNTGSTAVGSGAATNRSPLLKPKNSKQNVFDNFTL